MTIFADCVGVGLTAIEDCAGESVSYRASGDAVTIANAVAARVGRNESDVAQSTVKSTSRVQWWRIRASSLSAAPLHGAVIEREDGRRYQVQNPFGGPVWEWAEGRNTHYLICSVEIKAAAS